MHYPILLTLFEKSDALPSQPQGLWCTLAKFVRNDLGFRTVDMVTNSLTPKLWWAIFIFVMN